MFSAFERMVAMRYLRSRRKEAFISVIAGFSFLGILLGVATLIVVMAVTQRKRLVRRRWLGLPIGMFVHLVLDGSIARPELFWWPLGGAGAFGQSLPELSAGIWLLVGELIGLGALLWAVGRFGLDDADRRRRFLHTGQLDRTIAGEEPDAGC